MSRKALCSACLLVLIHACSPPENRSAPAYEGPPPAELGRLTDQGETAAFDRLIALAADTSAEGSLRYEAISVLGELGDPRAVEPLIAILEDDLERRTGVWAAAIPSLGAQGDPRAFDVLVRCLDERAEDWLGREMAAHALGMLGDKRAAAPLIQALPYADTREPALTALKQLGVELPADLEAELH